MVLNENLLTYRRTFGSSHTVDLLLGFSVQQDEMNNNTGKALGAASNTIHYAPWYSQVYDAEARLDLKDYETISPQPVPKSAEESRIKGISNAHKFG